VNDDFNRSFSADQTYSAQTICHEISVRPGATIWKKNIPIVSKVSSWSQLLPDMYKRTEFEGDWVTNRSTK